MKICFYDGDLHAGSNFRIQNFQFQIISQYSSPVSQYERPHAVAFASSTCVDKTTKIINEFTRKDLFTSETSELSTAKGISMK